MILLTVGGKKGYSPVKETAEINMRRETPGFL